MRDKKKIIISGIVLLIFILILGMVIFFIKSSSEKTSDKKQGGQNTIPPLSESLQEIVQEPLLDKELALYDGTNLPEEYKSADYDFDGLDNEDEIKYGTDMNNFDTDGDGISDYDEINRTKTDPLAYSSRNDGVSDMEYIIKEQKFEAGWNGTKLTGSYNAYFETRDDMLWDIKAVKDELFENLPTLSQIYKISGFSGKMGFCYKGLDDEKAAEIEIYKNNSGELIKLTTSIDTDNKMIVFDVNDGDTVCAIRKERG